MTANRAKNKSLHPLERTLSEERVDTHETVSRMKGISRRKSTGAFYTPSELARVVVEEAVESVMDSRRVRSSTGDIRILDPAVGAGVFLQESMRILSANGDCNIQLTGVDIESRALAVAEECLKSDNSSASKPRIELVNDDFMNWWWPSYDEKFDLIVGNPPWGLVHGRRGRTAEFLDISLDFANRSLSLLRDEGVLGLLLPGTWLCSRSYERFRRLLLSQNRNIKVIRLEGDWFTGAAYTSTPVALILGPKSADQAPSLDMSTLDEVLLKPVRIYTTLTEIVREYRSMRFPIAPLSFHRFLKSNEAEPSQAVDIRPARDWGLYAYAGVKTYGNDSYVFDYREAESMVASGQAALKWPLDDREAANGVDSDGYVLIPLGKGGNTSNHCGPTDFATPYGFYIRWDRNAVRNYASRASLRNRELYFTEGINFSASGQYCPVFRKSLNSVFDADYPLVPFGGDELWGVLALLNSPVSLFLAKNLINPTAHFKNNDFADLPIPNPHKLPGELMEMGRRFFQARISGSPMPESGYYSLMGGVADLYDLSEAERARVWEWFASARLKRHRKPSLGKVC